MGDMADWAEEQAFKEEARLEDLNTYYDDIHYNRIMLEYLRCNLVWITKIGERIVIQKMTNNHLLNVINFIESKAPEIRLPLQKVLECLYMEKRFRNL